VAHVLRFVLNVAEITGPQQMFNQVVLASQAGDEPTTERYSFSARDSGLCRIPVVPKAMYSLLVCLLFQELYFIGTPLSSSFSTTPLLPTDTERLTNLASVMVPLDISRSLLGKQSSCPQREKDKDVGGILSDIPQVAITSMHYVSLFDTY